MSGTGTASTTAHPSLSNSFLDGLDQDLADSDA